RAVAARDHAGEQVDVALELHAPKLFDVGVGAGRLVGGDGLDLALAEQSTLGVDLFRRHDVALVRRLAEHSRRAGEERHVTGTEGGIRNPAFGGPCSGFTRLRSGNTSLPGKA